MDPQEKKTVSDIRKKVIETVGEMMVSISKSSQEGKKPSGYWTRERCFVEAKKYLSKTELRKYNQTVYNAAKRNGWFDDYTWLEDRKKPNGYWNRDACYNEALKYKSRNDFQDNNKSAYYAAAKNGWINDYTWFVNRNIKWTRDTCRSEAEKYNSKTDFMKGSRGAYVVAKRNGWIIDYIWLERRRISDKPIYIVYQYYDKETNAVYVGLTNNIKTRHRQHCFGKIKNGKRVFDAVYNYFQSIGKGVPQPTILEKELYANDAQIYEGLYIQQYIESNFNVLNSAKAGSLGGLGSWTKERCYKEAEQYTSKSDFQKGCASAYKVAVENGWIEDYSWFEIKWRKKWNRETCYNEAKKYKSRGEFKTNSAGAYDVARKRGWIDDYTWFSVPTNTKKWNRKSCYDEAKKYVSKNEFRKHSSGAYNVAHRNGWLDDYSWFEQKRRPSGYWNRETCYSEAKKYNSIRDFEKGVPRACEIARKNGWLNDYNWFKRPKNYNKKWDIESCYNEAKKYKSRGEFKANCTGAYHAARINGWINDYYWLKERFVWTRIDCYKEAQKYKSRGEFALGNNGAYTAARKKGWLNDYNWFNKIRKNWDYSTCYDEAKKYVTRSEFKTGCGSAYSLAMKNGWIKDYEWLAPPKTHKEKIQQ